MSTDAFDLCKATFGKIPAGWQRELEALERSSTPSELEEAFSRSKANGAKHLNYVHETLRTMRAEQAPKQNGGTQRLPEKVQCDACEMPRWLDDLVLRDGFAVCSRCYERAGPVAENLEPNPQTSLSAKIVIENRKRLEAGLA